MPSSTQILEFAGFRLDIGDRLLLSPEGHAVALTPRLLDTLVFMVERPGRLIEKRALMESVWGRVVVEENTLSRTVSTLRQQLGESAGENRFIATVPGVGYRFMPAVTIADAQASATISRPPAIAVLPFEVVGAERDQQYFADGIAEELIMQLSAVNGLRVIAKASSSRLAGVAARDVGKRLSVSHVMTGAVHRRDAQLRIDVQLIDAGTGQTLWSGQYDRRLDDILAVQEDISQAVAHALRGPMRLAARATGQSGPRSAAAFDLYLRAKSATARNSSESLELAIKLARSALALDPDFALAWAQISGWARNLMFFSATEVARLREVVEEASAQALRLAPQWWPSHLAQSALHNLNRDWIEMEHSLSRAAEFAPGFPWELNINWGNFHIHVGDATAGVEYMREAVLLDPMSLHTSSVYQLTLLLSGQEAVAESEYVRSLALPGDRDMVEHVALHRAWARGGDFAQQFRRYVAHQSFSMPVLTALVEHHDQRVHMVRELRKAASLPFYQDPPRQLILAWWLAKFDAVEAALAIMTRAYVQLGYPNVSWLWFPAFTAVRQEPGFAAILEYTGLAAYWKSRQNWGEFCEPGADGTARCKL